MPLWSVVSKHLDCLVLRQKNLTICSGAFAFFGPGDYGDMYTALSRPAADNKLHFAGEAISIRHAYVF